MCLYSQWNVEWCMCSQARVVDRNCMSLRTQQLHGRNLNGGKGTFSNDGSPSIRSAVVVIKSHVTSNIFFRRLHTSPCNQLRIGAADRDAPVVLLPQHTSPSLSVVRQQNQSSRHLPSHMLFRFCIFSNLSCLFLSPTNPVLNS
mmetsp:Transcript_7388/g.27604  ORF Transcript_7388/g.27604 Transcript_7388/m.27604 type:complete len:144 (+) Transcript_7388:54-485(+)